MAFDSLRVCQHGYRAGAVGIPRRTGGRGSPRTAWRGWEVRTGGWPHAIDPEEAIEKIVDLTQNGRPKDETHGAAGRWERWLRSRRASSNAGGSSAGSDRIPSRDVQAVELSPVRERTWRRRRFLPNPAGLSCCFADGTCSRCKYWTVLRRRFPP